MMKKVLQNKVEVLGVDNSVGLKSPMELEYYILESSSHEHEYLGCKPVFGVEIVKKLQSQLVERKSILNYTCCKESAIKLIDKLSKHTVTPTTMHFIVDDLLGT